MATSPMSSRASESSGSRGSPEPSTKPERESSAWRQFLGSLKRSLSDMAPSVRGRRKTSEELITSFGVEDPKKLCRVWTRRMLLIFVYYILGGAVYTQIEDRPCDNQPAVRSVENVAVDKGDFQCDNCTCFEVAEECRQDWTVLDAIYWATVTVTTVGYGDYAPETEAGRAFGFFYILFGLMFTLGAINELVGAILDMLQRRTSRTLDPGEANRAARSINVNIFLSMLLITVVVLLGGLAYALLEKWTFLEGAWFSFITTTTVGYGDLTLENSDSRIFTIFFILFNVTLMTVLIGYISSASYQLRQERKRAELLKSSLTPSVIAALDRDGDGVDQFEFVFGMLEILEVVTEDDIRPWLKKFHELDADHNGRLDKDDLAALGFELQKEQIEAEEEAAKEGTFSNLLSSSRRGLNDSRDSRVEGLNRAAMGDPVGIRGIGTGSAVDPSVGAPRRGGMRTGSEEKKETGGPRSGAPDSAV